MLRSKVITLCFFFSLITTLGCSTEEQFNKRTQSESSAEQDLEQSKASESQEMALTLFDDWPKQCKEKSGANLDKCYRCCNAYYDKCMSDFSDVMVGGLADVTALGGVGQEFRCDSYFSHCTFSCKTRSWERDRLKPEIDQP